MEDHMNTYKKIFIFASILMTSLSAFAVPPKTYTSAIECFNHTVYIKKADRVPPRCNQIIDSLYSNPGELSQELQASLKDFINTKNTFFQPESIWGESKTGYNLTCSFCRHIDKKKFCADEEPNDVFKVEDSK